MAPQYKRNVTRKATRQYFSGPWIFIYRTLKHYTSQPNTVVDFEFQKAKKQTVFLVITRPKKIFFVHIEQGEVRQKSPLNK